MLKEGGNKISICKSLILQLSDPKDAQSFLHRTLKDSRSDWAMIRRALGSSVRPILGYPNGYYDLGTS